MAVDEPKRLEPTVVMMHAKSLLDSDINIAETVITLARAASKMRNPILRCETDRVNNTIKLIVEEGSRMYHIKNNYHVNRLPDGSVEVLEGDSDGAQTLFAMSPQEWASVVAHVSADGGTEGIEEILRRHMGMK